MPEFVVETQRIKDAVDCIRMAIQTEESRHAEAIKLLQDRLKDWLDICPHGYRTNGKCDTCGQ